MLKQSLLAVCLLLSPVLSTSLQAADAPVTQSVPAAVAVAQININSADADTLARELKGIGAVKARAIIEYREAQGPFQQVDDLLEVQGIGTALLERNRARLTVN